MTRHVWSILVVCIGCGSIPDVVFVPDGERDGGGQLDGSAVDSGSSDGGAQDVAVEAAPPCSNPPGGQCCGAVPCVGSGCNRSSCESDCAALSCGDKGKVCCLRGNRKECVSTEDDCH